MELWYQSDSHCLIMKKSEILSKQGAGIDFLLHDMVKTHLPVAWLSDKETDEVIPHD